MMMKLLKWLLGIKDVKVVEEVVSDENGDEFWGGRKGSWGA